MINMMIKQLINMLLLGVIALPASILSQELITRNDSDSDGVVDTADIDDDNDGVPDIWEIGEDGGDIDTDKDGMPDRLDLDSDNDSLLDWQESGASRVANFASLEIIAGRLSGFVGQNGMLNVFETSGDSRQLVYALLDSDAPMDGVPDLRDLDSDNDGLPDIREAGVIRIMDNDGDARIDAPPGSVGRDGIPDQIQNINDKSCCDLNADGADDVTPRNTDGTDFPDFQDRDSDNDGKSDLLEAGGTDIDLNGVIDNFSDTTSNGMDDSLIALPLAFIDNNGNGISAEVDSAELPAEVAPGGAEQADQPLADDYQPVRDPAIRPGSERLPLDDAAEVGFVQTGLGASGCSIASQSYDVLLAVLTIFSIAVLGWRFTLRRLR